MNWNLSRRWIVIGVVLIIVLAVLVWMGHHRDYRTVAGVEAVLDASGVRAGASAERVRVVLDSLQATHSDFVTGGVVTVNFGRSSRDLFAHGDIVGRFQFDTAGRLVSRDRNHGGFSAALAGFVFRLRRRDNPLIRDALHRHTVLAISPPWTSRGGIPQSLPYSSWTPNLREWWGPPGAWSVHLLASLTILELEALCRAA